MNLHGNMSTPTAALAIAAVIGVFVYLGWWASENVSGPEAAEWRRANDRGGCPEGYVAAPVVGFATNRGAVFAQTCVPEVRR